MADSETLARWPGRDRREPTRRERNYLVLAPLARGIRMAIERRCGGRRDLTVLDVGCGVKPYLPLVAPYAASYRGLDAAPGAAVDDVAPAEALPYKDASFDLVLCTQVLEHVEDPVAVLSELWRVLVPGGVALVSTHGVMLYHPDPAETDRDYWRWTHSGLTKLFRDGGWERIEVQPNGNVVACLGFIVAQFVDEAASRLHGVRLRRAALAVVNSTAEWIDAHYPPRARVPRPGSLSANYLVVAQKVHG